MSNIEPYRQIMKTNIKEHNDMVDKINEIVDVVNDTNLESFAKLTDDVNALKSDVANINTRNNEQDASIGAAETDIASLKTNDNYLSDKVEQIETNLISTEQAVATNQSDIATLKGSNASQNAKITAIQTKDTEQDASIDNLVSGLANANTEITGLSTSLISDVEMTDGTNAGSVQVTLIREDNQHITSANYLWGRDIGARLQAGTTPNTFKLFIDLSDGTVIESNEYLSSHEVVEGDIYVTAITLVPDVDNGQLGGTISYSNGTTQTINKVSVPTNPGVTSAIETLQTRMTAVETKNASQDTAINGLGTRLTTAEGKITTAQTDISGIKNKNIEQDGELTSLDARVTAIEDTPGIGKFTNSNSGTILGSTTDGYVSADEQGRGKVSGWDTVKDNANAGSSALGNLSKLFIKKTANVMKLYYYDAVTQTTTPINNIDGSDVITELSLAGNGNNGLQVKANGEISNIATLVKTASLSKPNNNQMQVSVNGVTGTAQTIINSVDASVDGNNLTVNVNGVSGTATLPAQNGGGYKTVKDYNTCTEIGYSGIMDQAVTIGNLTSYKGIGISYGNKTTKIEEQYSYVIFDLEPLRKEYEKDETITGQNISNILSDNDHILYFVTLIKKGPTNWGNYISLFIRKENNTPYIRGINVNTGSTNITGVANKTDNWVGIRIWGLK